MKKLFLYLIIVNCLATFISASTQAAISQWKGVEQGQVRLLTSGGLQGTNNHYLIGIEIALEPGWKTYWRNPGESGIPTEINFSSSSNLKNAETFYPIPTTHFDGYSNSIVYFDHVIFPIKVVPEDPNLPINLHTLVTYGLCETVCIPGEVALDTTLFPNDTIDKSSLSIINTVLEQIPSPAQPNDKIAITSVEETKNDKGIIGLIITAKIIENGLQPDLFVVGPPNIYIEMPEFQYHSKNQGQWFLSLSNIKQRNFNLHFTLVQESNAIEKIWNLN